MRCNLRMVRWLLLVFLAVCTSSTAFAKPSSRTTNQVSSWDKVRVLVVSRQYGAAKKLLLDKKRWTKKEDLRRQYWLGQVLFLSKDYKAAIKALSVVVNAKSFLSTKALMVVAEAAAKAKDFKKAQSIYAKHLKVLLSAERRLAMAKVYLQYADKYFLKAKKNKVKRSQHYRKAIKMFNYALEIGLPPAKKRIVMLRLGQSYLAVKQSWYALRTFTKATKEFKTGKYADKFVFFLAASHLKYKQKRKARQILFDMIKDFPKSSKLPDAYYQIAKSYGMPRRINKRYLMLGLDVLNQLIKKFPKHPKAQQASFDIGYSYYYNYRYDDAIRALSSFVVKYADKLGKDKKRYLARARFQIADCYKRQKHYDKAIQAYQSFLKAHPTDRLWPQAQRQIVTSRYENATALHQRKKWKKASKAFQQFLQQYPLDSRNPQIMYKLASIALETKQYKKAIAGFNRLVSKYPSSYYGRYAQWMVAEIYEKKLRDLNKALAAYKRIKYWRYRSRARLAIRRLTGKGLQLVSPRVFDTKEGATLFADVRNIKSLNVRMYRVDAETYFRKVYRFAGMEQLDIQLIRPDKEWTIKVPKYKKLKPFKVNIPLKTKKPMVAVVQVSGGGLMATTVAIISDLQIISKVSRRSLFVFALNGATKKPVAGAKLIVANGSKVLFEGKTGKDGAFQLKHKSLRSASSLRVLAHHKGSVAATDSYMGSLSVGRNVSASGLLFTDRPAYRPGDKVQLRGVLREVDQGNYQLPTKPYTLEVTAPGGQVVYRHVHKPSTWGTINASFQSTSASPLGSYRIRAYRKKGPSFYGYFKLARYKLPKYQLSIKMKQRVFRHRQSIEGTLVARYGFGAPAAKKMLSYSLGSLRGKGVTNAKGELTFKLNTRELNMDRAYTLSAMMPGERAAASIKVWMRSTEFDLGVKTIRKVYAAGDAFEVSVRAADPLGNPKAATVELTWLKRVYSQGSWVERKVGSKQVNVGKSGNGSVQLQIKQGGKYILRATAKDTWKQTIVASAYVFVSGDDDKQVLRLLSDKDNFNVGDKANVTLLNRKAGVALLTYEANSVVFYKLIPSLALGKTLLPVSFTSALSPNFALSVALLHKQKLYQARKVFVVHRKLKVVLKPTKKVWAPGAEAEVEITTLDQTGKPVAAEVSLAVVDKALLSIYPDTVQGLGTYFYRFRRNLSWATRSSHTYRHAPSTTKVPTVIARLMKESAKQQAQTGYGRRGRYWRRRRRRARRRYRNGRSRNQGFSLGNAFGKNLDTNLPSGKPVTLITGSNRVQTRNEGESLRSQIRNFLRKRFKTTAYWNASIQTNAKGKAVVKFKLPDNMATWKLHARGVAHPTLVGEGKDSIVTRRQFFVQLQAPTVVSSKDKVAPRAVLHNQTGQTLSATLTLKVKGTGQTQTLKIEVPAKQSKEVTLSTISAAGSAGKKLSLDLAATATHKKESWNDAVSHAIQVRMPGVRVQSGVSGLLREAALKTLKLPGSGPFKNVKLKVLIGPVSSAWILSMVEKSSSSSWAIPGVLVHQADLLMTGLSYLKKQGQSNSPQARHMLSRLRQVVQALRLQRRPYSGWNYIGNNSDPSFSADVFRVLVKAKKDWGLLVSKAVLVQVRSLIKQAYHRSYQDETKALLLSALVEQPNRETNELFSYANRMFRQRTRLSLEGLCHLGHTLLSLNRASLAKDMLPQLEQGLKSVQSKKRIWPGRARKWTVPRLAQAACAVELMARLAPKNLKTQSAVMWLLQQQNGLRWPSMLLARRAVRALSEYYHKQNQQKVNATLQIVVDGKKRGTIMVKAGSAQASFSQLLGSKGSLKLKIVPKGMGLLQYSATLEGYSSEKGLKVRTYHNIYRSYLPAYRTVGRKTIKPGFSVLRGSYKRWQNTVRRLPVGQYTRVKVVVKLKKLHRSNDNLVVVEPLPAGTMVLPSSISVSNGSYMLEDGQIRFFLYRNQRYWTYKYRLYGVREGSYHIPATSAVSYAYPNRFSLGSGHQLSVIGADDKPETYRLTPNDLYYLGQAYAKQGKLQKARALLEKLLAKYSLRYYYLGRVAHILFQSSLKKGPYAAVVKYFELLKEHSPNSVIPFDQILRVGQAYAGSGEYERAFMVYQATMAARFLKELNVAQALEKEGEFQAAVRFIRGLLRLYPDLRTVQEGYYGLAQSVFQFADKCKGKSEKRTKWLKEAVRLLRRFVWLYPEHPSADAASYTRANVMMALGQKKAATKYLQTLATRYPKSGYLADIHYLEAYSLYLQRRSKRALSLLLRVSKQQYPDGKGGLERSKNRHLASYLIAQIYHAADKLNLALKWYKAVKSRFVDAAAQAKYFQKVFLKMPEVHTVQPKAKAEVKVDHQNIRKAKVLVYYVDLMKLYLLKKNLNAVTRINLAGIRPSYQGTRVLGTKQEFGPRITSMKLPLKRRGSYLVVLKSKEKEVSGIVLRTNLGMDVQEDSSTGRVVIHLYERGSRKPVPHALVRVIGSSDGKFQSGKTDLRGIFTATNVRGNATVIAQKSDDFVFFRGKTYLQKRRRYRPTNKYRRYNFSGSDVSGNLNMDMLQNIKKRNYYLQKSGRKRLEKLYKRSKKGVQLKYLK